MRAILTGLILSVALAAQPVSAKLPTHPVRVAAPQHTAQPKVIPKPVAKPAAAGGDADTSAPAVKPVPTGTSIDTSAKQAIIIDMTTGTVLFEKNADERMPTSSMSKILTMDVVFDAIEKGQLKLTDTLPVSEKAWRTQGSKMFIKVGDQVKVDDLIHGVIIQSGNDACIALAEGLAGTEEAFVSKMNQKAQAIGMQNSHFMNASGLPDPEHYSTARDLSKLAMQYIGAHPDFYALHKQIDFTYNGIKQGNRNPLLYANVGADGLKTGHTEDGGYGLIGTATQNGRRILMVLNGMESMKDRGEESVRLISWGFRAYASPLIFKAGDKITTAPVWLGQQPDVELTTPADIRATFPRLNSGDLKVEVQYKGPLSAPLKIGEEVGKILVSTPGSPEPKEYPLTVAQDVDALSAFARIPAALKYLLNGHS